MVCLGDSLTHGRVSHNYVDALDGRFSDDYLFVNAAVIREIAQARQLAYLPLNEILT